MTTVTHGLGGGKAAAGGCMGEVINESHLVPPVLELGVDAR